MESHGFRHAEVALEKAPGVLRGVALGDSQTFGAGVDLGDDYPAVAERLLRERGLRVELVNAAVAGYKSVQALRLLRTRLLAWDLDFVVVDCIPDDAGDQRDTQDLPPDPAATILERTLFYSRLYRALRLAVDEVRPGAVHPMRAAGSGGGSTGSEPRVRGNHDTLLALGEAEGVEVFFLDYPFQAHPATALSGAGKLPAGARVVDSTSALLASGGSAEELFLDNNHLSVRGNRLVGAALAAALEPCLRHLAAGEVCPSGAPLLDPRGSGPPSVNAP